jgi:hypothetical protein
VKGIECSPHQKSACCQSTIHCPTKGKKDLWIETKNSTPTKMPIEQVSAKVPRTGGVLGPSYFPKWGWYQKLGWNQYTWKKRRGVNLNWFSQEFRPTFGFALLAPSLQLIFFKSLKILPILWADTQFRPLYDHTQIGDRTRITGSN